jgi:hypothetical protein
MSDINTASEPLIHKPSAEGEMALRADMLKAKTGQEGDQERTSSKVETEAKTAAAGAPEPEVEGEVGSKSAREQASEVPQMDASEGDQTEKVSANGVSGGQASAKSSNAQQSSSKSTSSNETVSKFMSTLQAAETSRDPEAIAALFHDGAELWRQNFSKGQQSDSASLFWKQYLENFKDVKSTFTKVQEQSGLAVLEWESEGHLKNGEGFHYAGVSILNFEEAGKISSFKTYFDSSALSMKARDVAH